jgi:predicted glycoside hydrolase/deacetylase ChbG (UPF0249 family)
VGQITRLVLAVLIVNADDWGRRVTETDAALECFKRGRVTSVSAMVFMHDSQRAADLARASHIDVGLHVNFCEPFNWGEPPPDLVKAQADLTRFLMGSKYAQLVYNPFLRRRFALSFEAQLREFNRLYGTAPSHIDGHHHMHLCGNMLLSTLLPAGCKIRRNFSFWPGEKSALNRAYRAMVDRWLRRRHRMTDYFFDLGLSMRENKLSRVATLAKTKSVELMTHPVLVEEANFLLGNAFHDFMRELPSGSFAAL